MALALDITEDAARQRLSRGRKLLRSEVDRMIESALVNSRPSARFTTGVMSLIVTGWSSTTGQAATVGIVGKSIASSAVLAESKIAASGAVAGAAGGLLGALGGLIGTWLGIRIPQWLAPTMTERKLLEREGRVIWRLTLIFSCAVFATVAWALFHGPKAIQATVLTSVLMSTVLALFCVIRGIRLSGQIKHIRQTIAPEQDPNPTWLKDRVGPVNQLGKAKCSGRRITSQRQVWGWPVYDFQVSDIASTAASSKPLHAKGWIAVGDKATGFIAIGGTAKGFLAMGGRSLGVISFGGLSAGLLSAGGLALGILACGGLAIGHSAIGGGAVGWQAAGGGAVGIYSANGGLAIAGHTAEGGLAISAKYAVGGDARAPEANTDVASLECRKSWVANYLGRHAIANNPQAFRWRVAIYFAILPMVFFMLVTVGFRMLMYQPRASKDYR
ncbi:MAG: hypothetical protein KF752_06250 [Pirellulaceae bacterium]|nr:hypothetical protein [Pirellulaceae bacterium]